MPIEVTARHMHASQATQDYARQKAQELVDEFTRVEHIHVILDRQKRQHTAEFVIQAKNHIRVEAEESADDLLVAVDQAVEKVAKQLRRLRDKVQDHRGKLRPARPAGEAEDREETEP
jgi:putative sigma-54 modulation protein